ncbi:MAG: GGDEF domain-containing protein [Nitriliruptor sp.]|uniref:GGDEF domain-containing protein n=1 Tax=Nitriliruptor sp. TaxID=2448056 RepID=UPI00349FEA07
MGRPNAATRTRTTLERLVDRLDSTSAQVVVLGGGLLLSFLAHGVLHENAAWVAAPVALVAGTAAGTRVALWVAAVAVVGHLGLDMVDGIGQREVPGLFVRSAVLPFLALAGTAGAQLERQRDRALRQAINEDAVTGLLNVKVFYDEVDRLRSEGTPFAVLLADIRGMRTLNETYGHPTGTEAVRVLAHVLRRAIGNEATASRLGSDEVGVLLVGDDRHRCRSVVADVIERLGRETVTLPDGDALEVHAAYGIARWPEDGDDAITLLRGAEHAKELAKAAGLDEVGQA